MRRLVIGTRLDSEGVKYSKEFRTTKLDEIGRKVALEILNGDEFQKKFPFKWEENSDNYSQKLFGHYIETKYLLDLMTTVNGSHYYADVEFCWTNKFNGRNIFNFVRKPTNGYCKDYEWSKNKNALFEIKLYPLLDKFFIINRDTLAEISSSGITKFINGKETKIIPLCCMTEYKLSKFVRLDDKMEYGDYYFINSIDQNSWLNRFCPNKIVENQIQFKSLQHYYQYKKAQLFGQQDLFQWILNQQNPYQVSNIGKKVKLFNQNIWNQKKIEILKNGLRLLLVQNKFLINQLLNTKDDILLSIGNMNQKLDIGIGYSNSKIFNRNFWIGDNLYGSILMQYREKLIKSK